MHIASQHTATKWIGITLGLMLSACNTVQTLPVDLDYDDAEPVSFRASWTATNNWVTEFSYSEASGADTIALVGGADDSFESRLHHKGVTLAGSQQVKVQSDFSQAKLRLLLPIPSPKKWIYTGVQP